MIMDQACRNVNVTNGSNHWILLDLSQIFLHWAMCTNPHLPIGMLNVGKSIKKLR